MFHLRVILRGNLFNKAVQNVFYYRSGQIVAPTPTDLQSFNAAFVTQVLTPLRAFTSTAMDWDEIETFVIEDAENIRWISGLDSEGNISGDCLPAYFCYYFRLEVPQRLTRPGRKAFAGVPEAVYFNETNVNAQYNPHVVAMQNALNDTISDGNNNWEPVVVRIVRDPITNQEVVTRSQLVNLARFVRFSTQNSRKIGRGS